MCRPRLMKVRPRVPVHRAGLDPSLPHQTPGPGSWAKEGSEDSRASVGTRWPGGAGRPRPNLEMAVRAVQQLSEITACLEAEGQRPATRLFSPPLRAAPGWVICGSE